MLTIENLHASINGAPILNGIDLKLGAGEVHAIMGPNGSGKSTLVKTLVGHPSYEVVSGKVWMDHYGEEKNLFDLEPHERALEGIFLGFQYPIEIPGISNLTFLHESFNSVCKYHGAKTLNESEFLTLLKPKLEELSMNESFLHRSVNEGFSGGEKKKNEILQMSILNPKIALLDETDSGLDIDALKVVANGVNALRSPFNSILLVTHYQRLLDYIKPDFVHVLHKGKIIKSGTAQLALELEERGYDWLIEAL